MLYVSLLKQENIFVTQNDMVSLIILIIRDNEAMMMFTQTAIWYAMQMSSSFKVSAVDGFASFAIDARAVALIRITDI